MTKSYDLLTVTSLLAIVLMTLHLADDVVRGFESGGLKNLIGIAILVVWSVGALLLAGRRSGYVILLLGALLAAAMPAVHMAGNGVGGALAASPGGYFFIWTLFALGVTGTFLGILSLRGLWSLRRQTRAGEIQAGPARPGPLEEGGEATGERAAEQRALPPTRRDPGDAHGHPR